MFVYMLLYIYEYMMCICICCIKTKRCSHDSAQTAMEVKSLRKRLFPDIDCRVDTCLDLLSRLRDTSMHPAPTRHQQQKQQQGKSRRRRRTTTTSGSSSSSQQRL